MCSLLCGNRNGDDFGDDEDEYDDSDSDDDDDCACGARAGNAKTSVYCDGALPYMPEYALQRGLGGTTLLGGTTFRDMTR